MTRNTEQYIWNILFTLFFLLCLLFATLLVTTKHGAHSVFRLNLFEMFLIALASQRVIRLFVYDAVMTWFRELFYDTKELQSGEVELIKPERGPRRTIVDLLTCPWCFGLWATASVSFIYLMTPYAYYPILLLALSSVASTLQITINWIGHNAEAAKQRNAK